MANARDVQQRSVDPMTLMLIARRALGSETVEVAQWQSEQLHGGVVSEVHRFSGLGMDQGRAVPWSVIRKVVQPSPEGTDSSTATYVTREALAYRCGLLQDLPDGLAAPECYGVVEQRDGSHWLWLEDIQDEVGTPWPMEHYGLVARQLGQFNGAYLVGRPIPSHSWLTNQCFLCQGPSERGAGIAFLRSSLGHPLVGRAFPADVVDGLSRLCDDEEMLLKALDRLPQTFCHRDAFCRNLFARRSDCDSYETVAIDWAMTGIGALGEEIVPLVIATLFFNDVDNPHALELDHVVFDSYLRGLGDVGWQGDSRGVRLGYTANSALRYGTRYVGNITGIIADESRHTWAEQLMGRSMEEQVEGTAAYFRFLLDLADEARQLLSAVGWR